MKRIAIADIHLSAYKDDPITDIDLPQRLSDLIKVVRSICTFARQQGIKNIDILGDLTHDKNVIYTDAQNSFKDILLDYSDLDFLIFSGNHDLSSTGENQTSSISAFDGYSNVECYTKPVVLDNITIVPYSNTMVQDLIDEEPNDILLSHFGLSEAQLQSGISLVTNIKMKDLAKFKLVLLGHYHKPQFLQNNTTNLYYVGNPTHTSWNDKNEQKRFLVYDTETLEVQSYPISGYKQYVEYQLTDESDSKEILEKAALAKSEGHHVRIRKNTKEEIEIDKELVVIDNTEVDVTNRGITTDLAINKKLEKYLEIKEISNEKIDSYMDIAKRLVGGTI